jgi:hypothetical protein
MDLNLVMPSPLLTLETGKNEQQTSTSKNAAPAMKVGISKT